MYHFSFFFNLQKQPIMTKGLIIVLGSCALMACGFKNTSKPMKNPTSFFDVQGHRGCRGLRPENTIPAMLHALELNVTTLEMDAVLTADGEVVLSHEPFFNHEISTKPDGSFVTATEEQSLNIFKMNYNVVATYDVGKKVHPRFPEQVKMHATKPRLKDVIDSVKNWCAVHKRPLPFFNIETKSEVATDEKFHPSPVSFCDAIYNVLEKEHILDKVIFQSFDFRTLKYLHSKHPEIPLAALVEATATEVFAKQIEQLGFVPAIWSPDYHMVTPILVRQCRALGMRLIPWTVNNLEDAKRLKEMGINGIITDYPDRIH